MLVPSILKASADLAWSTLMPCIRVCVLLYVCSAVYETRTYGAMRGAGGNSPTSTLSFMPVVRFLMADFELNYELFVYFVEMLATCYFFLYLCHSIHSLK